MSTTVAAADSSANAGGVIKPDHAASRKHMIFTDEHDDLRESMKSWVAEGARATRR